MNAPTAWILRLVPVIIMAQTLPFKFTGAAESKALFATLTEKALGNPGLEAMARLGTGVVELIAIVLLLIPKFSQKGALLTIGTMAGALVSHVAFLGFSGMHGQLAGMAAVALIFSAVYLVLSRRTAK
ncbi:DoxX family protein [Akkermansiaceae bacterium]|nr:DoxX family protein [Akkermansiaceae bacterium]